jgi:hypothetical protein
VLEEQTLANLQKISDRLGIRVSKGLSGALTQAMFGPVKPSRRQYIETLANSDLVTLEDIDRIFHTHYSRLPDDTRGMGYTPIAHGTLSDIFMQPRPETRVERFLTLESLIRHILHSYVTKSDLQKICQNLGLPGTGNKGDLEARILGDSGMTNALALNYVDRDDMKKLCVDLKLATTGTRGDMERRVANVIARLPRSPPNKPSYEPPRYTPPMAQTPTVATYAPPFQRTPIAPQPTSPAPAPDAETFSGQNVENGPPTEPPEYSVLPSPPPTVPEPPPVPLIPARPGLDSVIEFIEDWGPTQRFKDESKYQIELAADLRNKFGSKSVMTELNVLGGRIDIEVLGIGVEIKVPSKVQLQRLIGQANMYQKHYGPNVIVVIFNDKAKTQDINWFCNDLARLGIKFLVK